jgi:hypothetical protein
MIPVVQQEQEHEQAPTPDKGVLLATVVSLSTLFLLILQEGWGTFRRCWCGCCSWLDVSH